MASQPSIIAVSRMTEASSAACCALDGGGCMAHNSPDRGDSMYIADAKRLTHDGARKMIATAIDKAREAKIAISCCIVDAGGHVVVLERMDGGRFDTLHSCTTKAVCAASNKRATTAKGAVGQDLDVAHALGLALAAGPGRWTAMEGGVPILANRESIGGVRGSRGAAERHLGDR